MIEGPERCDVARLHSRRGPWAKEHRCLQDTEKGEEMDFPWVKCSPVSARRPVSGF